MRRVCSAYLGVLEAIEQVAFRPSAIWLFDGLTGKRLAEIPLGAYAEKRYRAPYLTLHRADLHAALHAACKAATIVTLKPRFDGDGGRAGRDASVRAISADGRVAEASALIGADGVWSEVRKMIAPDARLVFAGATAWRTLLPRGELGQPFDAPVVCVWLGPDAHLVHYPVRGGKELNVVAVTEGGADTRGWNQAGDAGALSSAFAGWCKESKSLLERSDRLAVLVAPSARPAWTAGRAAGSRSSAMPPTRSFPISRKVPHLPSRTRSCWRQDLAECGGDALTAFPLYEAMRKRRAASVAPKV